MPEEYRNIYKICRRSAGFTQEAAAERLGISVESLRAYETGQRVPPDEVVETMSDLYNALHLIVRHVRERNAMYSRVVPEVPLFGGVIDFTSSYNLSEKDFSQLRKKYSISGICAICPEIIFDGKLFCFTGESYRAKRAEIMETITSLGGKARSSVSAKTDYLIVGNAGNPCWAYACYGRKIEEAMNLRKGGAGIVIVNETDFWDAVDDALSGITD